MLVYALLSVSRSYVPLLVPTTYCKVWRSDYVESSYSQPSGWTHAMPQLTTTTTTASCSLTLCRERERPRDVLRVSCLLSLHYYTQGGSPLLLYVHVDHRPDVGVAGGEAVGRPRAAMRHALSQERRSQEKPATPQRAPSWCHHPE